MLVDTHAHLYWDSYKGDFSEVIKRCKDAGVETIINVGVDVDKSKKALRLSGSAGSLSEYSLSKVEGIQFYSTIGIHPHEATKYASTNNQETNNKIQKDMDKLQEIYRANPNKVIGVGECGLDFLFREQDSRRSGDRRIARMTVEQLKQLQRKLFKAQINLAKKLDLPLIVHCRDDRSKNPENIECWKECLDMISGYKGILHCYSGTLPITKRTMNDELTNFLVSFAGNITYPKNDYLREAVKILPLEKIVLETDCPFLAPQNIRGQRNEPSSVLKIAQLIAEIKGVSLSEVAKQTTKNVKKLFNI